MTREAEVVAVAMSVHRRALEHSRFGGLFAGYVNACTCEKVFSGISEEDVDTKLSEHQSEAVVQSLRDSRFAVVELPEPDSRGRWSSKVGVNDNGFLKWAVGVDSDGKPFTHARRGPGAAFAVKEEFRAFAAAILAASQEKEVSDVE